MHDHRILGQRARACALAMLILLVAVGASSPLDAWARRSSQDDMQALFHDGLQRSYLLRLPPSLPTDGRRLPLVIVLHGGGGNAAIAEAMTGFTEVGRRDGFIVVYPQGSGRRDDVLLTWNARHCCGHAMDQGVDDVGFIRDLIDLLKTRYPIDPRRVYATGMSNGGMMAHRLGIELADRIAAIAPVVATVFGDESTPAVSVSALMINGALDQHVPVGGGAPGGRFSRAWDGTPTRPTMQQAQFWAAVDHCTVPPRYDRSTPIEHWAYACPGGRAVELYLLGDSGHAWPGGQRGSRRGDTPSTALDASTVIWKFFATHPKP
jgi:polyhydroxybutyrate depolymerase